MGAGASVSTESMVVADALLTVTHTSPVEAKAPHAEGGPPLKQLLEDMRFASHFKMYILKDYKGDVMASDAARQGGAEKLAMLAQNCLQFYLDVVDFEMFTESAVKLMRAEGISNKYLTGEQRLPVSRVAMEATVLKLDSEKVPSLDIFSNLKFDTFDYLEWEVYPYYLKNEGPFGYKSGAFAISAANLRKAFRKPSAEESQLLDAVLTDPAKTALLRDFLVKLKADELLFLLLDLMDLKQMITAMKHAARDDPEIADSIMEGGHRFVLTRVNRVYDRFMRARFSFRNNLDPSEIVEVVERISRTQDLSPTMLDSLVAKTFDALYDYFVDFMQEMKVTGELKKLDDVREERRREVQAHFQQQELKQTASELGRPLSEGAADKKRGKPMEQEAEELLRVLYCDKEVEKSFVAHLSKVNLANLVYFWRDVEDFKSIPRNQTNFIQGRAEKLFEKYVKRGATSEVALTIQTRGDILSKIFRADTRLFDKAMKDVLSTLLPEYIVWQAKSQQSARPQEHKQMDFFDQLAPSASSKLDDKQKLMPITFGELLNVTAYCIFFKKFAESEFCMPPLLFWGDVQEWKQLPQSDLRESKYRKIYNKFLRENGNMPVSISATAKQEVTECMEGFRALTFDLAEREVYYFLRNVLLPKFLDSEQYRNLLAALTLDTVHEFVGTQKIARYPVSPTAQNGQDVMFVVDDAPTQGVTAFPEPPEPVAPLSTTSHRSKKGREPHYRTSTSLLMETSERSMRRRRSSSASTRKAKLSSVGGSGRKLKGFVSMAPGQGPSETQAAATEGAAENGKAPEGDTITDLSEKPKTEKRGLLREDSKRGVVKISKSKERSASRRALKESAPDKIRSPVSSDSRLPGLGDGPVPDYTIKDDEGGGGGDGMGGIDYSIKEDDEALAPIPGFDTVPIPRLVRDCEESPCASAGGEAAECMPPCRPTEAPSPKSMRPMEDGVVPPMPLRAGTELVKVPSMAEETDLMMSSVGLVKDAGEGAGGLETGGEGQGSGQGVPPTTVELQSSRSSNSSRSASSELDSARSVESACSTVTARSDTSTSREEPLRPDNVPVIQRQDRSFSTGRGDQSPPPSARLCMFPLLPPSTSTPRRSTSDGSARQPQQADPDKESGSQSEAKPVVTCVTGRGEGGGGSEAPPLPTEGKVPTPSPTNYVSSVDREAKISSSLPSSVSGGVGPPAIRTQNTFQPVPVAATPPTRPTSPTAQVAAPVTPQSSARAGGSGVSWGSMYGSTAAPEAPSAVCSPTAGKSPRFLHPLRMFPLLDRKESKAQPSDDRKRQSPPPLPSSSRAEPKQPDFSKTMETRMSSTVGRGGPGATARLVLSTKVPSTLRDLLNDKVALKFFFNYCVARHCEENLLFALEAEDYRMLPCSIHYRARQAKRIFALYISDRADMQVSLAPQLRLELEAMLDRPTEDMFAAAADMVMQHLEHDAYRSYQESAQYAAYKTVVDQTASYIEMTYQLVL